MLVADDITQGYGTKAVLTSFSVRLEPGVTALLGPNGAGKTTLLRTLATVQPPKNGRLIVAGQEVASEKSARLARREIGYLPQRFGYDPGMKVQDFVYYGAWVRGMRSKELKSEVSDALEYVGLSDQAHRKMKSLSGGMRQRAAIAWAIVGRPRIVLLDEPTVGLDPQQRFSFRELVAGLKDVTVVLSTHLTDDVDAVCDRVLVLENGATVFQGSKEELKLLDDPQMLGNTPIERAYVSLLSSSDGCPR